MVIDPFGVTAMRTPGGQWRTSEGRLFDVLSVDDGWRTADQVIALQTASVNAGHATSNSLTDGYRQLSRLWMAHLAACARCNYDRPCIPCETDLDGIHACGCRLAPESDGTRLKDALARIGAALIARGVSERMLRALSVDVYREMVP